MSEDKKSDYTEVHEEPRRMSEEDVKDYHGLTLNEQGEEYRKEAPQGGIHIEFIDVKAIPWWKKALYIAGIIAFLAIVLAVAWFFLVWGAVIFLAGVIVYFLKNICFERIPSACRQAGSFCMEKDAFCLRIPLYNERDFFITF